MAESTTQSTNRANNMVVRQPTLSKYHLLYCVNHNNNYHSGSYKIGRIENEMFNNDKLVGGSIADLTDKPELAYYKDG